MFAKKYEIHGFWIQKDLPGGAWGILTSFIVSITMLSGTWSRTDLIRLRTIVTDKDYYPTSITTRSSTCKRMRFLNYYRICPQIPSVCVISSNEDHWNATHQVLIGVDIRAGPNNIWSQVRGWRGDCRSHEEWKLCYVRQKWCRV